LVIGDHHLRVHLRHLVELEFPEVPVLAQRELTEGLRPDRSRVVEVA
jgi:flagellar biosynthesis component FlhA